jgi:hypothetical protein
LLNRSDTLSVDLVAPTVWRPLVEQAVADPALAVEDRQRLRQLTEALIAAFHDRHAGITPALAAGLAYLLLEPTAQQQVRRPWQAVIARLRRELRRAAPEQPLDGRGAERQRGFLLRDAPSYTVLRLALPLVARACREVGRALLFCADQLPDGVGKGSYEAYATDLHQALFDLAACDEQARAAGTPDDDDAPFWAEVALTLAGRSLLGTPEDPAPPLPEVEPLALAWLLRLRPDPEPPLESAAQPRVMLTPLKRQKSRRLQEGGISGYRLTRRLEDLDEIVLSELLYPDTIFYDRILNSGYLVVERPPRHQKRRDVLTVGMLPPGVERLPAAGMLKACWFDCVWRFAVFLRGQQLTRSEIRWIEGGGAELARSASYLLGELPAVAADTGPGEGERWMFLRSLRWVPSFLNQRGRPTLLRLAPEGSPAGGPGDLPLPELPWLRAAWQAQRENQSVEPGARPPSRPRSWPEVVAEFAHTHLLVCLPASLLDSFRARQEERVAALRLHRRLQAQFRFAAGAGTYLSLTFVPEQPLDAGGWLVATGAGVLGLEQVEASPERIAGGLEAIWLGQLIKDMSRG